MENKSNPPTRSSRKGIPQVRTKRPGARLQDLTGTPVKAYLAQGYFNPIEIVAKLEQIDRIKAECPNGSAATDSIIAGLEKEIDSLRAGYTELKKHIDAYTANEYCRQIFILRFFNGLKTREIAERLDLAVNTVQEKYSVALKEFEIHLLKNGIKY